MFLKLMTLIFATLIIAGCTGFTEDSSSATSDTGFVSTSTPPAAPFVPTDPIVPEDPIIPDDPVDPDDPTPTHHNPEPNTLALLGVGLAGLIGAALWKKKKVS